MRTAAPVALVVTALMLASSAVSVVGQDGAEPDASPAIAGGLERPSVGVPLVGETRSDGTIVLSDADYCSYLLSELWGERELTFSGLIDESAEQQDAKAAAFQPFSDEATLLRCAEVIGAFRGGVSADDTLPSWSRESPVIPAALEVLLPSELFAEVPALVGTVWTPDEDNPEFLFVQQAAVALGEAGLKVHACQVVRHRLIDQFRIVAQDPPAGTVLEPGSSIVVQIHWPAECSSLPLTEDASVS